MTYSLESLCLVGSKCSWQRSGAYLVVYIKSASFDLRDDANAY